MTEPENYLDRAYTLKDPEDARNFYDSWADTYDANVVGDHHYTGPTRMAAVFAEYAGSPDDFLIDIGCGTGLGGEALMALGFKRIDGLDLSQGMLDQAAAKGVYQSLIQADMTKHTGIPEATYDAVVSVGAFTHRHIGPAGFDECLRMAKPGAILCLMVNDGNFVEENYQAKLDALTTSGACTVLLNRIESRIIETDIDGRIVVMRKS